MDLMGGMGLEYDLGETKIVLEENPQGCWIDMRLNVD
jgi:hypothetical protein